MNKKIIFGIIFTMIFLVGIVSAAWTSDLDTDLVGYWKLNESTGTTATDSYSTNDGTADNADVFSSNITGIIYSGADFTGATTRDINLTNNIDISGNFTINLWIKGMPNTSEYGIIGRYSGGNSGDWLLECGNNGLSCFIGFWDGGGFHSIASPPSPLTNDWTMITATYNEYYFNLYFNGVANVSTAYQGYLPTSGVSTIVGNVNRNAQGYMDEIGIWNRTLNNAEITQLYNNGNGITYTISASLTSSLNSPSTGSSSSADSIEFNSTGTPIGTTITNGTLKIWYTNGTLYYNETNLTSISNQAYYIFNVSNFSIGNYKWNVEICSDDTSCASASSNFTFDWVPFSNENEIYDDVVFETSLQTFRINISTDSEWTVSNGRLIYNGTTYSYATKEDLGGGDFQLTQTINIPIGDRDYSSEARDFQWNITLTEIATGTDFSSITTSHNQTVKEIILKICNGTITNPVLNFTMLDEKTGIEINGSKYPTTFKATFDFGLDSTYLERNYTINNLTVSMSQFDFCVNNDTLLPYVDMNGYYTATSYTDKNYHLSNASLNGSATNEISLYLLNESNALEFFIDVKQDLSPVTGAIVNIKKYFVGEGVYKTVEIDETSSDSGEFTAYLDLDKKYSFTITKNNEVLGTVTKTASCKEAPCELTLSLESELTNIYSQFSAQFGRDVVYSLTWNPVTKIVTFDFTDTTGLANYFKMVIYQTNYNTNASIVYENKLYTSSGTMTANMSAYDDGDFTAKVYVSRSPEKLIDYIEFSLREFVGEFGLLGLFFAFLLVLTIIFGFSFKPSILVFAIPLSLTILTYMGIAIISGGALTVVYVLAIIAAFAMK